MAVNYIVSGYMRTGTSMMMQALEAGGMETVWSKRRERTNAHFSNGSYRPNIEGLYELDENEIYSRGFPTQYEGKVIKLLSTKIRILKPAKYLIVFMRRDEREILISYEAAFSGEKAPLIEKSVEEDTKDILAWLEAKGGVTLTVLWYRDVLSSPLTAFKALAAEGWPIDPRKAAAVVDMQQYRCRAA